MVGFGLIQLGIATIHLRVGVLFTLENSGPGDWTTVGGMLGLSLLSLSSSAHGAAVERRWYAMPNQ